MTTALLGYGTTFSWGDGNSPESFTAFLEVAAISPPKAKIDSIDTSHELPPLSTREAFPGFVDWGEITINFNFVPGNASALRLISEVNNQPISNRKVTFPNGRVWSFAAFLTGWETTQAAGDKLAGSATFKITGDVIFT